MVFRVSIFRAYSDSCSLAFAPGWLLPLTHTFIQTHTHTHAHKHAHAHKHTCRQMHVHRETHLCWITVLPLRDPSVNAPLIPANSFQKTESEPTKNRKPPTKGLNSLVTRLGTSKSVCSASRSSAVKFTFLSQRLIH